MILIEWSKRLETGISEIDSQHRVLVNILNQLHTANNESDPKVKHLITQMNLQHLVEYTTYHFETEEKLMASKHYSGLQEHKMSHDILKKKVVDLVEKFNKGEEVMESILTFLKYWLQSHILSTDMEYVSALKNA